MMPHTNDWAEFHDQYIKGRTVNVFRGSHLYAKMVFHTPRIAQNPLLAADANFSVQTALNNFYHY